MLTFEPKSVVPAPLSILNDIKIRAPLSDLMAGPAKIATRKSEFTSISKWQALDTKYPMYDLHDFAHLATATLEHNLYGNMYQSSLHTLKADYTRLVTSPGEHKFEEYHPFLPF